MGKFESYPEANALGDNDITLYNKNTVTHKVTFSRLVNLIKDKIAQTGLVTSISTGAGLVGDTITSSGTIKCKLKSETVSSLSSANPTITANRQYPVGLDREGYLSVNVPWTENSTYSSGTAIDITNETINVILDNTYSSSSTAKAASAKAVKDAYDNSMRKDGSNADTHVRFSNALTVGGTRKQNSTIGNNSVAFGYGNIASAHNSFASGIYTEAKGYASHSEGNGTDQPNYINGQYNEYNDNATANITATADGSHAEGHTTYDDQSGITGIIQANGMGSHAEGYAEGGQGDGVIIAYGKGSHAEGYANSAIFGGDCANIAHGNGSHVEGIGTYAGGVGSHAEGIICTANGESSHAEGYNTTASGNYSHTEGQGTTASISCAHAEGHNTIASGNYSHAEGDNTNASGGYSHAEGQNTKATKAYTHAEGYNSQANANYSHAEGYNTKTTGVYSHAEGNGTQASGNCSYAGGYNTVASGNYSHAGGAYAEASFPSQLVQGAYDAKYNNATSYGRGVFGISPNAKYYATPYTIQAQNGHSATVASGVEMTLVLDKYAMYMLYWTTYSGTNDATMSSGMHLISTSAEINNPRVQDILAENIIDSVGACRIILLDSNKYMYHLIRII